MEHAYWKQMIEIEENGIFLVFGITRNDQIKFLHFSSVPQAEDMSVQECRQEDECRMMDEGFLWCSWNWLAMIGHMSGMEINMW